MDGSTPLTATERDELARLREEVTALRAGAPHGDGGQATTRGRRGARLGRWVACGLLLTMMAVTVIGGVAARYVRSQLLDTDRYVATVTPIGETPAVQAQISDAVTTAILERLNVEAIAEEALSAIADNTQGVAPRVSDRLPQLAPLIANGAEGLVRREVTSFVSSARFEQLWVDANRVAHRNLVSVLTGEGTTAVQADRNGTVTLSLGPVIDEVKARLVDRGIGIANSIPAVNPQLVLVQSEDLVTAQRGVRLLDRAADVLPWIAIALGAVAVWASPRGARRRALTALGLVVVTAMLLLGLGVNVGRSVYLSAVPPDVLPFETAVALIDPLLVPLRWMLRAVLVLGLAITLGSYVTGTSRSAVVLRSTTGRAVARMRGRNRVPTPFEVWVGTHRRLLQVAVLLVGVLVLMSWTYPSGSTVAWIAIVTGFLVLAIYAAGASTSSPTAAEPGAAAAAEPGALPSPEGGG